jgi:hypothetical protein
MASSDPNETAVAVRSARESIKQGRLDDALRILHQTVQRNPRSTEAYELLGVAYAQKGLHTEGIQALSTAVNLKPDSVFARINLAVAYQRANRLHEAEFQLKEALRLDPGNEKARQSLYSVQTRLGTAAPQTPVQAPPPQVAAPYQAHPPYGQPQPQAGYGQAQSYNPQSYPPQPGYVPPAQYAQQPAYGQPPPYAYAQQSYVAPGYGPHAGYGTNPYSGTPTDPTGWSPANIGPILTSPVEFFQAQRGQRDLGQPIAYMSVLWAFTIVFIGIMMLTGMQGLSPNMPSSAASGAAAGGMVVGLVIGAVIGWVFLLIGIFITAGIFHGTSAIFGGKGGYAGTFRALVYSYTPALLMSMLNMLVQRMMGPNQVVSLVIGLGGALWAFVLLCIALREIHGLQTSTAFVAAFLGAVLFVGACILIGLIIGGMFAAVLGPLGYPRGGYSGSGFPSNPTFPSNSPFSSSPGFGQPPSGLGGPPPGFGQPPPGFGSPNFGRPDFGGPPSGFPR